MWNHHLAFQNLVRGAWRENALDKAIHEFTMKARQWNKEVFSNIFWKKRRLAARLLGIQNSLAANPNAFLLSLQDQLSDEFNQILQWEEELWAMKARTNWLITGERNTSYFHLSTIVRRSANRISCVKLENEKWIYDVDQTKHYFQEVF